MAALFVVACSSGADELGPTGEVEEAPPPTENPPTEPPETADTDDVPDEFAIPDDPADIDEDYIDRVMAELHRVRGEAVRTIKQELALSEPVRDRFGAILRDDAYENAIELWEERFADDPELSMIHDEPGDAEVKVEDLLSVSDGCAFFSAWIDFSDEVVGLEDPQEFLFYLEASPLAPNRYNRTPWIEAGNLALEGVDQSDVVNPCQEALE